VRHVNLVQSESIANFINVFFSFLFGQAGNG